MMKPALIRRTRKVQTDVVAAIDVAERLRANLDLLSAELLVSMGGMQQVDFCEQQKEEETQQSLPLDPFRSPLVEDYD